MDIQQCQTKRLLKIVGAERHDYEADVVSDAESVLERRLGGSREKRRCKDRMMGGVRIIIGLAMLTLGVLAIAATLEIKMIVGGYLNPVVALFYLCLPYCCWVTSLIYVWFDGDCKWKRAVFNYPLSPDWFSIGLPVIGKYLRLCSAFGWSFR